MGLYDQLKNTDKDLTSEFKKLFSQHTVSKEFLTSATLELTPLCNFRCAFCYARCTQEELDKKGIKVKGFEEWKRYIDELADMNCPEMNFTGGECTLHPDFCRLYDYSYDKGFMISVFTNASNITDEILELFKRKPPQDIYITLYGNSPEVYAKVTGNAKYHDIVKANVEKLIKNKMNVILQGTFCADNAPDLEALFDYAASLNCDFKYTGKLITYGHCTKESKAQLLASEELMKKASYNIWHKRRGLDPNNSPTANIETHVVPTAPDNKSIGIKCNGGKNTCFIRHDGMMAPCNTFDAHLVDTKDRPVKECFKEITEFVNNLPRIMECEGCIHARHCISCVAAHYNDTGKLGVPSPMICFKILEPEKAKEEQEFYNKHGYVKA